ncbi:uncharacterized protein isoform X3 [Rhodnius prolixus]|uniref:uncharacterized protein isoform X3 n=1 Tax=Rhodnius prolixus TaxID=13249 RepID=UPI003D189C49
MAARATLATKGEGCVEKPLSTLWKNYQGSCKPDVQMKVTVTQSGLKAVTKEHGLTEYWSHRITYCAAPTNYPKVFCWVYRHEGRKLKQELRCHAVLCSKESTARRMASDLSFRLAQALIEFKRDKLNKQNARLSLANSVYDNPTMPRRKILLSTGSQNYRPPLERSKSAPKLMSIEESVEEEEEPEVVRKSFRSRERMRIMTARQEDPFKEGVHVPGEFDLQEEFKGFVEPKEDNKVELNPSVLRDRNPGNHNNKELMRMSWGGEEISENYNSDLVSGYDLVETSSETDLDEHHSLVLFQKEILRRDRKILLESLIESGAEHLESTLTKLYPDLDYLDEESTPSLQSISSGSDRPLKHAYDLDSLSEEDSDESGFVEVANGDDKIRDLPHHHLVKPCLLTTKSSSLEV